MSFIILILSSHIKAYQTKVIEDGLGTLLVAYLHSIFVGVIYTFIFSVILFGIFQFLTTFFMFSPVFLIRIVQFSFGCLCIGIIFIPYYDGLLMILKKKVDSATDVEGFKICEQAIFANTVLILLGIVSYYFTITRFNEYINEMYMKSPIN